MAAVSCSYVFLCPFLGLQVSAQETRAMLGKKSLTGSVCMGLKGVAVQTVLTP